MSKHTAVRMALCLAGALTTIQAQAQYQVQNLVSDGFVPADHIDPNLVNPWGIAMSPTGPFWIANNGSATSTLYDGEGEPQPPGSPLVVAMPGGAAPTGIEFYGGTGFAVFNRQSIAPSRFIFVTEDGTIAGWSPNVDRFNAIKRVDNSASHAIYKGVAIAKMGDADRLYAANFYSGMVEIYDSNFMLVGSFTDPNLPQGYAPFGIENVGGKLIVTFALQDESKEDDVPGPGNGFVSVFNPDGTLAKRLISQGWLNAPWGVVMAPEDGFGEFSGKLLIGNFGDGWINAYDPDSGAFLGSLRGGDGQPIVEDGLWALTFGNGVMSDEDELYFTAGPGEEAHGLFGEIKFTP